MKRSQAFRLPSELLDKARAIAPLTGDSVTAIVERALRKELTTLEESLDSIVATKVAQIKGN